jgi:hypothetical protein
MRIQSEKLDPDSPLCQIQEHKRLKNEATDGRDAYKKEPGRVFRTVVADSHHLNEDLVPGWLELMNRSAKAS